jgi:ABC-type Fe3+ transport system permease subunit
MNCKNCGTELRENDCFCPSCGEYCNVSENAPKTIHREGTPVYQEPNATLWIIIGVLSAVFCCLIGGIATTVYAARADGNIHSRDLDSANENIEKAKKWFIATVIVGVISIFIGMVVGA